VLVLGVFVPDWDGFGFPVFFFFFSFCVLGVFCAGLGWLWLLGHYSLNSQQYSL
jgi:hypothetical protein